MAKNKTEKCRYPSTFSPGQWVHFAAYMTEQICQRKAFLAYSTLPPQFWKIKEWNTYYRFQITVLNRLLKKYSEDAILKTFNEKECSYVYSFNSPVFLKRLNVNKDYVKPKVELIQKESSQIMRPAQKNNHNFMSEL